MSNTVYGLLLFQVCLILAFSEQNKTTGNYFCILTHMRRMDFPILIIWMSPFSFLGTSAVFVHFYFIFDEIRESKQDSPRWDAAFSRFEASHMGLFCVPMSHKKDAGLIWA